MQILLFLTTGSIFYTLRLESDLVSYQPIVRVRIYLYITLCYMLLRRAVCLFWIYTSQNICAIFFRPFEEIECSSSRRLECV